MVRHIKAAVYTLLLVLGFIYLPLGTGHYVIPEIVPGICTNSRNLIMCEWMTGALFAFMVFMVVAIILFIYHEFLGKEPQQDM